MIEISAILAAIAANPWTAIIVSNDGQIEEMVPLSAELTAASFSEFSRTHAKGRRFRLVRQADLSEAELNAIVAALLQPAEPARSWRAEPSVFTEKRMWTPFAEARAMADGLAAFISRRMR